MINAVLTLLEVRQTEIRHFNAAVRFLLSTVNRNISFAQWSKD